MNTRKQAVGAGFATVALLTVVWAAQGGTPDEAYPDRAAYEAMLAAHPYNTRPLIDSEALRAIPKKDRPDLAAEQDFLLTMDPATGTVPIERLFEANRIARQLQEEAEARGGGPLVTRDWEDRGPNNVGGRTRALMFDPNDPTGNKVWAGGVAGGLWYNDDITSASAEWTSVDDFWPNLAAASIAYDPTDPQVMYVGTGEGYLNFDSVRGAGIFKTTDGGLNWELLASTDTSSFWFVQRLAVHPTTGDVFAATRSGMFRSQDDGGSWESVQTGAFNDVEVATNGTIYTTTGVAFTAGFVYSSTTGDAGSWTQLNNGTNGMPNIGLSRIEIAVTPADPLVLYAVAASPGGTVAGLWRTADGGANWTALSRPVDADPGIGADFSRGQAWYDLSIAVDPNNVGTAFVGGIDVFKTTDSGASWRQISHWYGGFGFPEVHADQHAVVFKPGSSDEIVFSHDGGVTYTANGTATQPTLPPRNTSYNVTQFYANALAPEAGSNVMLAGAQDNGTQRYSTPGVNATTEVYGGDGGFNFIDQTQSSIAIASYVYNNYYRSANGGLTFGTGLINENTGSFINPADYDDREDILYTYRNSNELWRVTGVTTVFTRTTLPVAMLSVATSLTVSPFAPAGTSTLYVGTSSGRIFRVENAQATATVTELTPPPGAGSNSCIEFGASEDHILVTRANYGIPSVWETRDGGTTWENKEGNLPDMPVRWALYNPLNPNGVLLATETGVWETTNFGAAAPTWTPAPGFPLASTRMLQYRPSDGTVMATTHGRGSFTAIFRGFPTAGEPGVDGAIAGTHRLSASAPNPFRSQTRFTLAVAEPQHVRLTLLDAQGRRMRVVHDGALAAGAAYPFEVDGRGLPSGAYVVAVEGERFRDRLRVTLVR